MRLKKCKHCGQIFESIKKYQYLCQDCALKSKQASVIKKRTCKQCGIAFDGGPRAWYCPECRRERWLKYDRDYKKSNKTKRKLGSIDICQVCGKEYIVAGGRQKYCPECTESAVKQTVRAHKRQYQKEYRITHIKQKAVKICVICGKELITDTSTVTCSKECAKKLKSMWQRKADEKRTPRKR